MGKSKGSRRDPDGADEKFPLFAWAESYAAKRGRKLEDFSTVSIKAVPFLCSLLVAGWLGVAEDSPLRIIFAVGTLVTLFFTFLAWVTRLFQSNAASPGFSIVLHMLSLSGAGITICMVMGLVLIHDLNAAARKSERMATDQDAARKNQEELAAQEREERAAELQCQKLRAVAVESARKVQRNASKSLENCKKEFTNQLFAQGTIEQYCKNQRDFVDGARRSVAAADNRICSTASIKSPR